MRYTPNYIVDIYNNSPIFLRNLFSSCYGFLKAMLENNSEFDNILIGSLKTQWWKKEKLEELQVEKIKKLIKHCNDNVPYYQKVFAKYGIISSQIQTPKDLQKIPILNKQDIIKNFNELFATNYSKNQLVQEVTSGTTGKPFRVFMNRDAYIQDLAFSKRIHNWAGYKSQKDWFAKLSGHKVVPINRNKPPFWIKNYYGKQIHLSSFHLKDENIKCYYDIITKMKVKYLGGYPSAIGLLAKFMKNNNLKVKLKGIFIGSEPIYQWQTDSINEVFGCKIFNYYGQAERVLTAAGCGDDLGLHINMEIYVPFLSKTLSENKYNLISTSLTNFGMPLINYNLNDVTSGLIDKCSCGRELIKIKPIETKMEDYILTPSENYISASILTFPFKKTAGLIESQIIQEKINLLIVNVVTNNLFTSFVSEKLKNEIISCIGDKIEVRINKVNKIQRTKNGKFRFVISELSKKTLGNYI